MVPVDARCKKGTTALMESLRHEQYNSVKALLQDFNANPNILDNNGISPLMQCCLDEDERALNILLKFSPTIDVDFSNKEGITALMMACNENQINLVERLLEHGSNLNKTDKYGWNCLFYAIYSNASIDLIKIVIDYGIGLEAQDKEDGWNALHLATTKPNLFKGILDYLDFRIASRQQAFNVMHSKTRLGSGLMHLAAQGGNAESLQYLISRNDFDINETIKQTGWRPLHFACHRGHLCCVRVLIEGGAQSHVFDDDGSSPFNIAVQMGHSTIVEYFIEFQRKKNDKRFEYADSQNDSSILVEEEDYDDIFMEVDNDGWAPVSCS